MPRNVQKTKDRSLSKRMRMLTPFIPCFFDIPFKDALSILGCSHHTLDPIRREMKLERWPFTDMLRGENRDRSNIIALRALMMSQASEDMQRCLCLAATRAEECWRGGVYQRQAPRRGGKKKMQVAPSRPPSPGGCEAKPGSARQSGLGQGQADAGSTRQKSPSAQADPDTQPAESSYASVWQEDDGDETDQAFWLEISELLQLQEAGMAQLPPDPMPLA